MIALDIRKKGISPLLPSPLFPKLLRFHCGLWGHIFSLPLQASKRRRIGFGFGKGDMQCHQIENFGCFPFSHFEQPRSIGESWIQDRENQKGEDRDENRSLPPQNPHKPHRFRFPIPYPGTNSKKNMPVPPTKTKKS